MSISAAAASEFIINGMLKYAESLARVRAIQAEGREKLTPEEWRQIVSDADAARAVAQDEVDRAIAAGR
jgi:hypothetical protein